MADDEPELVLEDLSVTVTMAGRRRRILAGATFSIARGDVVAVVGPSGGGKSTLLKAVLGLVAFTEGRMVFRGETVAQPLDRTHRTLRHAAEAVFQNPVTALNPHRTLRHTIEEPLAADQMPAVMRRPLAEEMAARMGLATDVLDRRPLAVSVGQAQRAAIARALVPRRPLLFLDEPLSALDAVVAHEVSHLLAETIRDLRPTVVIVSHDLRIVRRLANRVIVVDAGRIVEDASTACFMAGPKSDAGFALVTSDRRRRAVFENAAGLSPTSADVG